MRNMKIDFEKDANVKSTIVLKYGFHRDSLTKDCLSQKFNPKV